MVRKPLKIVKSPEVIPIIIINAGYTRFSSPGVNESLSISAVNFINMYEERKSIRPAYNSFLIELPRSFNLKKLVINAGLTIIYTYLLYIMFGNF